MLQQKLLNISYKKFLIALTFLLPNYGKLLLITTHVIFFSRYKIPVTFITLPIILGGVLSTKMLLAGSSPRDFLWLIKPFGLIIGFLIGKYLIAFSEKMPMTHIKSYKKYFGLSILVIAFLQWYGFDIWSGSGSFGVRATGGFRGFGELAFFAFFFSISNYLLISLMLCVLSSSKIVILATLLGLIVNLRYRRSIFHIIISLVGSLLVIWIITGADMSFVKNYSSALYYSVFGCGLDCSSFANRSLQTQDFFSQFSNTAFLLLGSTDSSLFVVSPEIAILFYYKLYGIFGLLPFIVLYLYFGRFFWGKCIIGLILLDVYMLSPIGYILLGIIVSARFKLHNWVRRSMK